MSRQQHLVSATQLRGLLGRVRLLDARWRLTDSPGEGRARYAAGHLPGARFVDLETVLTTHTDDPRDGRHPLPDVADLERGLAELGVTADDDLVVYDEPGSSAAERAWWVLRWAGLRVRLLDGGLPAWVEAGGDLETGEPAAAPPSTLRLSFGAMPILDTDAAAEYARTGLLLDARAAQRYRGEVEPYDPKAGHIPGAMNVPATDLYTDDGRMPADDELRRLLPDLGAGPVAAYCGSGVTAARDVLALAVLDVDAALFPGSWSAWSNDPSRPVATGPDPGGPTGDNPG